VISRTRSPLIRPNEEPVDRVFVTYSTEIFPPRTIHLDPALYREATPAEQGANARFKFLPKDPDGRAGEMKAIAADVALQAGAIAETFDVEMP
jgi:hypothetical protein